jgi:hypothetical protein
MNVTLYHPVERGVGRPVIEGAKTSRERPILFSGPMVRALLDGTKTQTRRVLKPGGDYRQDLVAPADGVPSRCRFGAPGDRLWVRETWACNPYDDALWYRATDQLPDKAEYGPLKWRPSIFMPRAASRITLVITGVRVERLQDITRGDAMAEGCPFANMARGEDPRVWYEHLWCNLNGADSWRANQWVWVVEFRKTPNA